MIKFSAVLIFVALFFETWAADEMKPIALKGYTAGATIYEAARPSYPKAAIDLISSISGGRALDLAAGTGKLTRLVVPHYESIVAIEPVAAMREEFKDAVPGIQVMNGSATQIPLPDASVDTVLVAQAFHWFPELDALREMHRVLSPGGKLVLIWNLEDQRSKWVHRLRDAYEKHDGEVPQYRKGLWKQVWDDPEAKKLFGKLQHQQFDWNMPGNTPEIIWDRIASKSYVSCLDDATKNALQKTISSILKQERIDGPVDYPYVTDVFYAEKI